MDVMPIAYQVVQEWDISDIIELYQSAGWWREHYDPTGIPPLIEGSFIFAVGIHTLTGKAVAMGRILSDHVSTGYIQDLCVLKEMRGMQIGTGLLNFLIQEGQKAGISSLRLIAEPDTRSFYEKSGFISNKELIFLTNTPDELHEI